MLYSDSDSLSSYHDNYTEWQEPVTLLDFPEDDSNAQLMTSEDFHNLMKKKRSE